MIADRSCQVVQVIRHRKRKSNHVLQCPSALLHTHCTDRRQPCAVSSHSNSGDRLSGCLSPTNAKTVRWHGSWCTTVHIAVRHATCSLELHIQPAGCTFIATAVAA